MIARAGVVWFAILVLAVMNGAVRTALFIPALGETAGRAASTVLLALAVVGVTFLTLGWIGPRATGDAWRVGGLWVALTLAFEFVAGHYLFGHSWQWLLQDYDLSAGRIWPLVLATCLLAPLLIFRTRRAAPESSAPSHPTPLRRQRAR